MPKRFLAKPEDSKYQGIYKEELADGDYTFKITYKDLYGKKKWQTIGREKRDNITITKCFNIRSKILLDQKFGENKQFIQTKKQKREEVTLNDVYELYIIDIRGRSKEKNVKDNISKYNKHLKDNFGELSLYDIKQSDIQKLLNTKAKELSPATINTIREKISTIYNFAIRSSEINYDGQNPAKFIKKIKVENERERFFELEELEKIYEEINNTFLEEADRLKYTLFAKIAVTTGVRLSNLIRLKVEDIDLKNKTITIRKTKTNTSYDAFIKESILDDLKKYIASKKPNDYVFYVDLVYTEDYENITKHYQRVFRNIFNKLFNEHYPQGHPKHAVLHTFRHTFATHLAKNRVPIYTIMKLMNHKDIKMTLRYAKHSPENGLEDVNNLPF